MDNNPLRELLIHIPWYRAQWYRVCRGFSRRCPFNAWQNLCDFLHRGRRGYAADDWINLNDYVAPIILACLKRMRESCMSYPLDLTPEEWDVSLDKMIAAFQTVVDDEIAWATSEEFLVGFAEFYNRFPDLWD